MGDDLTGMFDQLDLTEEIATITDDDIAQCPYCRFDQENRIELPIVIKKLRIRAGQILRQAIEERKQLVGMEEGDKRKEIEKRADSIKRSGDALWVLACAFLHLYEVKQSGEFISR